MENKQRAVQRALAIGRGRFRVRAPNGATEWGGWSSDDSVPLERFSGSECGPTHAECGQSLGEHGWIAPDVLVCPGDFLMLDEEGEPVLVLKARQLEAETIEAARWSVSLGSSGVERVHRPCGRPLAEHGLVGDKLVCPGDWVLEGPRQVSALSAHDLFALYEVVL